MNTRFYYLYRDRCNYKKFNDIVFSGEIQEKKIRSLLKDRLFFIPSVVNLPDLQHNPLSIDDHIWHEFEKIEITEDSPTIKINTNQFIDLFSKASHKNWYEYEVISRKGII